VNSLLARTLSSMSCFGVPRTPVRALAAMGLFGATACTANVDGGSAGRPAPGTVPAGSPTDPASTTPQLPTGAPPNAPFPTGPGGCLEGASLAPARLWRITDQQYVNVVQQVFGASINPEVSAAQGPVELLNLSSQGNVNASNAVNYQASARAAAQQLQGNLQAIMPCASAAPDAACVEQFVRSSVARAYRRPLLEDEVSELMALYQLGAADGPAVGVRLILETVLQSPNFLWRTEIGSGTTPAAPATQVTLSPFELASSLSFYLLNSAPDEALWAKASDGTLATPAVLASEVERMLALAEVRTRLTGSASMWLGLSRLQTRPKDAALFPEFTPQASAQLQESGWLFLQEMLWNGNFSDWFTTRKMFLNEQLAALYGIPAVTGAALTAVDVVSSERSAGLLSQPVVLAAHASPSQSDVVHRGLFVFDSIVCGATIPKPPANTVMEAVAALPPNSTQKEFANYRAMNPSCQACHAQFDPLGLAQEEYDALGRYQQADSSGQPIDASAVIVNLGPELDGAVNGATELAARLSQARRVADCAVSNLATIALGHDTKQAYSCALNTVMDTFATSGSFTDLYRALLSNPAMLTRDVK
jgi:hypothetical protein